ncbi:MAG TPA: hypothetical protein PK313_01095, partial [Myxococcota bacterium]|nr:hypothetical protein [Myxococcota bacterium]
MNAILEILKESVRDIPLTEWISTIVDVLIVYYLIYRAMLLIRGTRALQMLVGILFALGLFFVSQEEYLNLTTLNWVLEKFVSSFLVILI